MKSAVLPFADYPLTPTISNTLQPVSRNFIYSFIIFFPSCGCFGRLLPGEPIRHPCPPPSSYSFTLSAATAALPVSSCLAASPILPDHHSGGVQGSFRGILASWNLDTLPLSRALPGAAWTPAPAKSALWFIIWVYGCLIRADQIKPNQCNFILLFKRRIWLIGSSSSRDNFPQQPSWFDSLWIRCEVQFHSYYLQLHQPSPSITPD